MMQAWVLKATVGAAGTEVKLVALHCSHNHNERPQMGCNSTAVTITMRDPRWVATPRHIVHHGLKKYDRAIALRKGGHPFSMQVPFVRSKKIARKKSNLTLCKGTQHSRARHSCGMQIITQLAWQVLGAYMRTHTLTYEDEARTSRDWNEVRISTYCTHVRSQTMRAI